MINNIYVFSYHISLDVLNIITSFIENPFKESIRLRLDHSRHYMWNISLLDRFRLEQFYDHKISLIDFTKSQMGIYNIWRNVCISNNNIECNKQFIKFAKLYKHPIVSIVFANCNNNYIHNIVYYN